MNIDLEDTIGHQNYVILGCAKIKVYKNNPQSIIELNDEIIRVIMPKCHCHFNRRVDVCRAVREDHLEIFNKKFFENKCNLRVFFILKSAQFETPFIIMSFVNRIIFSLRFLPSNESFLICSTVEHIFRSGYL